MFKNININDFFVETLNDLKCNELTKAYIISIYNKYIISTYDMSQDNITLAFAQARAKHDFLAYQNIGDWIFFTQTMYPKHLNFASKDYYDTIAKLSYYSCYKLINREWKLYEQLADEFNYFEEETKNLLSKKLIPTFSIILK